MTGPRRRFLAPEVVQTSAMDCGPASLKCLLDGLGVPVSFGRLREACQTDVDGTSIDVLEDVMNQLGLQAEQIVLPLDHILHRASPVAPALVVIALPDTSTHFLVLWRVVGDWVQVMDPSDGRRWLRKANFLSQLYVHTQPVDAENWRAWAADDEFQVVLAARIRALGLEPGPLLAWANADTTWRGLGALDAAVRMCTSLVEAKALKARQAGGLVGALAREAVADPAAIPGSSWSVRELPDGRLGLRGGVLVRVKGVGPPAADLPPDLAHALAEPAPRPLRDFGVLVAKGGATPPLLLLAAVGLVTAGGLAETVLLRGTLELGNQLGLAEQRLTSVVMLIVFALAMLLVELPIATIALAMGRGLEYRLRAAFLEKIPRLADRYFQSRPASDMAHRSHSIHVLRTLPDAAGRLARAVLQLGATAGALIWLDPAGAPIVLMASVLCIAVPLAIQGPLSEIDLRFRTHGGSLSRFYLDAMLGLVAVRTHGAERALRRQHESLLTEWARAGRQALGVTVGAEVVQGLLAFALSVAIFAGWLWRGGTPATALLVVYWALELPALGVQIGQIVRMYPGLRSVTLRLLEPLGAAEEPTPTGELALPGDRAVALGFEDVTVVAGGHTILHGVDLQVGAGEHVAVVGASGAGKSSLVGLLLGWFRPVAGAVQVDGAPLDGPRLAGLRRATAWVDPTVHIWNRTFAENLTYGAEDGGDLATVIARADLIGVLQKLPAGLQEVLGEGGGLVSGGEGQRVRLGRALLHHDARLVILDEPFRGLDREKRRQLLNEARQWWQRATLLCVTHDVGETHTFDRVVVIDQGRVVEDGAPADLARREGGHYRALLAAEEDVRRTLWSAASWRKLHLDGGTLRERVDE